MPSKLKKVKKEINENLRIKREDVFTAGNGIKGQILLYLDGKLMSENEIHALKEEIVFLEATKIWNIYTETLKNAAIEKSIYKSTSFDDMRNGKEILEVINLLKSINAFVRAWKPNPIVELPTKPIVH